MTVTASNRKELVVAQSVGQEADIKSGDRTEFNESAGTINIAPEFPSADRDYTPAQGKVVNARLAAACMGPYRGPFDNTDEAIRFHKKEIRTRKATRKTS